MEPEFLTFRRFNEPAMAEELTTLLDVNGVTYEVEDNSVVFNPTFVADDVLSKEYCIKLRKEDFDRVNDLMLADEEQNIDRVDPDHYLFGFSDDELHDIMLNYDEWSTFDFALARKILNERGITVDAKGVEIIKAERLKALSTPEEAQTLWVAIGYGAAALGGVFGILIGWMMWRFKKTLPNGERIYAYIGRDRKHGKRIFILSIIVFIITAMFKLYHQYLGYY